VLTTLRIFHEIVISLNRLPVLPVNPDGAFIRSWKRWAYIRNPWHHHRPLDYL